MLKLNSLFRKASALACLAMVSVAAPVVSMAQSAIDPTAINATVTANEATVTSIGGTILGMVVLITAYRWVRRIIK